MSRLAHRHCSTMSSTASPAFLRAEIWVDFIDLYTGTGGRPRRPRTGSHVSLRASSVLVNGGLALRRSDPDAPAVGFGFDICSTQERFAPHQLVAAGGGELNTDAQVSLAFTLRLRAASASVRRFQPVASWTAELHTTFRTILTPPRRANEIERGLKIQHFFCVVSPLSPLAAPAACA